MLLLDVVTLRKSSSSISPVLGLELKKKNSISPSSYHPRLSIYFGTWPSSIYLYRRRETCWSWRSPVPWRSRRRAVTSGSRPAPQAQSRLLEQVLYSTVLYSTILYCSRPAPLAQSRLLEQVARRTWTWTWRETRIYFDDRTSLC